MPKPVTKAEFQAGDWFPEEWFPEEGPPAEICNEAFSPPKKLSEMTEDEKDDLCLQFVQHSKTVHARNVVELDPTKVFDPPRSKKRPVSSNATKTEEGIVVPGEDPAILASFVGKEQAERMMSGNARPVSDEEVERKEMSSKTAAERNAIARFKSI